MQPMFPATGSRPAIPVTWHAGGEKPEKELFGSQYTDKDLPISGALVVYCGESLPQIIVGWASAI